MTNLLIQLIEPNRAQKLVAKMFGNGEFAHFANPFTKEDLQKCGDSFFSLVMAEVGNDQDGPVSIATARRRIAAMSRDLDALIKMPDQLNLPKAKTKGRQSIITVL